MVVKYKVNFRIKSVIFYKVLSLAYYKTKIRLYVLFPTLRLGIVISSE